LNKTKCFKRQPIIIVLYIQILVIEIKRKNEKKKEEKLKSDKYFNTIHDAYNMNSCNNISNNTGKWYLIYKQAFNF
jgi:hypothetical protein